MKRQPVYDWPAGADLDAWAVLANGAMQLETLAIDQAENDAWILVMRELIGRRLDYAAFTEQRMAALKERIRGRKLAQTNLRYKYNLGRRKVRLVQRDVKRFLSLADSH